LTVNGAAIPLPSASVRVEELRGEAFGSAAWRISPLLTTEAGLRVETSTISQTGDAAVEKTLSFVKPRLSATWSPNPANQLRLRAEREVGQLDFGDFAASAELANGTVNAGNADLEPETGWVFEAAYERRFWGEGVAILTLRHKAIENAIDIVPIFTPGGVLSAPGNIGEGTLDELQFDLTVPLDRVGLRGGRLQTSTTIREAEVTDPTTGQTRFLSGVSRRDGEIVLSQDLPRWRLNWKLSYAPGNTVTSYRIDSINRQEIADYVEANVEYKPRPNITIRFTATTLGAIDQSRLVFAGPRGASPLSYRERVGVDPDPYFAIRTRFTF
ncbi:MAG TPA: TonB-dependent receptor, partial [Caulobacteraceae bacterium]